MAKPEALRHRQADAPTEVMREVATLALAKNLTQEGLATEWRSTVGGRINGGNISRHFATRLPEVETLRRYADVLGVKVEYLLLLQSHTFEDANALAAGHPDPARVSEDYWLNMLELEFQTPQWKQGTSAVVTSCLRGLPVNERRRHLEIFALAWYREEYLGTPVLSGHTALAAFEAAAPPDLNLPQFKSQRVPGEDRFVKLWDAVGDVLDVDDFDVLLAHVRALHRKRRIDVTVLDAALNDDDLYRAWREGRYKREVGQ